MNGSRSLRLAKSHPDSIGALDRIHLVYVNILGASIGWVTCLTEIYENCRIHLRLSEKTDLQSCLRDELDFSSNFLLT
jgi:hypothetical protein